MAFKIKEVLHELRHHAPFTLVATLTAVIIIALIYIFKSPDFIQSMQASFEVAHPLHLFVSAVTSAAMFYKYKQKILRATIVSVVVAIVIGSLSDIIFPFVGGLILGLKMEFHLPLLETPFIIIGVTLAGALIGIKTKLTHIPHFLHIFISVFASLFYIIAFGGAVTPFLFIMSFFVVFVSVIIPCCASDIVLPFFFLGERIKHCGCE